jgi:hypothetical protein
MINQDELILLWRNLHPLPGHSFTYKKVDPQFEADLNVGINAQGMKCIVLVLPADFPDHFPTDTLNTSISRKNIDLCLHGNRELVLLLKDDFYFSQFLEFIMALIPKVIRSDEYKSITIFISTIIAWLEMFEPSSKTGLSKIEVLGLIAELVILERELKLAPAAVDDILNGWRGPYNYSKDFELDSHYIEVKYKNKNKNVVKINSEFQLNNDSPKVVQLVVVSGEDDALNGTPLSSLYKLIRTHIRAINGNGSIFLKALAQLGVNRENIASYDHIKVKFFDISSYDTSQFTFPSIQKKNLHGAISKVTYNLDIKDLKAFLIKREEI